MLRICAAVIARRGDCVDRLHLSCDIDLILAAIGRGDDTRARDCFVTFFSAVAHSPGATHEE
jgi:hypothetical protein